MQNKLKRISALLCAFALLVTTVLGSSAMMLVKAAEPQEPTPVTLDGFKNLTLKDFADKDGVVMEAGEYEGSSGGAHHDYYAKGLTTLDKTLLSMKVKFEAGSYKNSLILAGTHGWQGFNIHPNDSGTELVVDKTWGGDITSATTPTLSASVAGVDSFINEEFLLQLSFEYGEAVGGKADLKLGIYINGTLYNDEIFTITGCSTSATGTVFAPYRQDDGKSIFLYNVNAAGTGPVQLEGFDNLTLKDFKDQNGVVMEAGEYEGSSGGAHHDYYAQGITSFHKKLLSMKVKFEAGEYKNSLILAGTHGWQGFNIHPSNDGTQLVVDKTWGGDITSSTTPTLSASVAGVDSFINEEFILQLSFEYGEAVGGKADLKLGIYINGTLYNDEIFTIAGCSTSATGTVFAPYRQDDGKSIFLENVVVEEAGPVQLEGFDNLTLKDFKDKDGVVMEAGEYEGSSGGAHHDYYAQGITSFHKKVLSMKVKFEAGEYKNSLILAGTHGWQGFNIHPSNDGTQLVVDKTWGGDITTSATPVLNASVAGVTSFIDEEFTLELSFEYGEAVSGKADLKLGIYINGNLYNNEVFTIAGCNTSATGTVFAPYRQDDGKSIFLDNFAVSEEEPDTPDEPTEIVPVELEGFTNLTIKDFVDKTGAQMPTGRHEGNSGGANNDYYVDGLTNFDKHLLSMKITYEGGEYKHSLVVGGTGEWSGFNLRPNGDGSILFIDSSWAGGIVDKDTYVAPHMTAALAGLDSFIGNEFLLQLSFEYGEEVGGKADLTIGVYINGKLYNNQEFVIPGCKVSAMGSHLALYREVDGSAIIVDNVSVDTPEEIGPVELEGFTNLTIKDFVDKTGAQMPTGRYEGNSGGANSYYYVDGLANFDKHLLSMKITYEGGEYKHSLVVGGTGEWSGFNLRPNGDGSILLIDSSWAGGIINTDTYSAPSMTAELAGLDSFIGNEFLLQLSFEYGEEVGGKADLTIGVYINGKLYNNQEFVIPGCKVSAMGSHLALYREVDGSAIIVDNVGDEEEQPPVNPENALPAEPDATLEKLTFSALGIAEKTYPYVNGDLAVQGNLQNKSSFDKTVFSGDVLLSGSGHFQMIFGGKTGGWDGLRIIVEHADTINAYWYKGEDGQHLATITSDSIGTAFVEETLKIALSTEVIDNDGDGNVNDIKIGLWLNEVPCTEEYIIIADKGDELGNKFGVYCSGTDASVTLGKPASEQPSDSLKKVTFSHFGVHDGTYASAPDINVKGTYADGDSVDGIVLCGDIQLINGNDGEIDIMLGSVTNVWEQGIRLTKYGAATDLRLIYQTSSSYKEVLSITPEKSGVDFASEKFNLMWSIEVVDNDNDGNKDDLKVGLWFNEALYEDAYCYINDYMTNSTLGNVFATYCAAGTSIALNSDPELKEDEPILPPAPPTEPIEPDESFEKVTFAHFNIKDGSYPYNGDIVVQSTLKGHDTLDKTLVCGDVLLEGEGSYQLLFGGKNGAWDGLRLIMNDANSMHVYWYQGHDGTYITSFAAAEAGVNFVGEQFNLMLSMEVIDNDIQVGVWLNGVLYGNEYIVIPGCAAELGNCFGAYCSGQDATVTLNSIPELVPEPVPPKKPNENFDKITFEYFGVKDAIYKFDGTDAPTFEGKGSENLDKKVLCGDILFKGESENHLMIGGKDNTWYGLRFITQANGTIVLYWIDDEGMILIDIFDDTTAGATLLGEWLNLMISTEILDADGDGEKDDIELGVWFNGVLYKEEFYTIIDKASGLGNRFGFDCPNEDNSIAIRSIPELVRGFDYSVYHLTRDWEKTLLTAHKAEIAKGGSRDAEPFTGDLLEIGKVCLFSAAGLAAVVAGVYMMIQRKRES